MKSRILLMRVVPCMILIFSINMHAQISTNELPPSFSTTLFSVRTNDIINLPVPNVAEALHEDSLFAGLKDIPYRVGLPILVNYTLENSGKWQSLGDTMRVWRLQLLIDGAKAITLNYDRFWIPNGAKLYVYNSDRTFCLGAFTSINNQGKRSESVKFATGLVAGDNIVIEYYEPVGVTPGIISIETVFYIYKKVLVSQSNLRTNWFGNSQPCNININCPEGADWQNEKKAVACILCNGYLCSGALINSTSKEDYFLTANHCFPNYDAQGNNLMGQMTFYWNYESTDCSNGLNFNPPTSTGAILVANNSYSDFALLKLIEPVKNVNKYIPYYLGWSRDSTRPTRGVTIHHPSGDIKKIAIDNSSLGDALDNTHWRASYDIGTTEGGSSGAPLLNASKRIVGQLHSGGTGCDISDNFGRFDKSWDHGNMPTRRLKDWLDPDNTGIMQIGGRGMEIVGAEYICDNNAYNIENLPSSVTVVWECNTTDLTLLINSPSTNQCTVKNQNKKNLSALLTAKVMKGNDLIATLTKNIIAINPFLSGYYRQEACIFYNVSHPAIPQQDINKTTAKFVHQGCMVYLTLYGIGPRRVSHSGINPDVWYYDGSTQIQFQLPLGSGGIPFYVEIGDDGSCAQQLVLFFSVSNNGNISQKQSSSNPDEILIMPKQLEKIHKFSNWSLEIYDTSSGTKVCDVKNITTPSYQLSTLGWTPNVYVVRVVMESDVYTDKIVVEK